MEETILYRENPPMFRNNPLGFILSVLLIPVFGVGIVILVWWYIQVKSRLLTITDTELRYETGILSKTHNEFRLDSIRSVRVHQSLWQRMFGTGNLEIFTAGDTPEVTIAGVPDPARVRELVN
jgi:uncharacterized membrane protein YdbT with pleckstrin-like domain